MKIGNIELNGKNLAAVIAAALSISALAVYLIFFSPLVKDIRAKYREAAFLEDKIREARGIIDSAAKMGAAKTLKTEEDVSQAIDELTKHGKTTGVKYISIKPKEPKNDEAGYAILPVEMEIESTYACLAGFLGSLDELNNSIVRVKSFDIIIHNNDPMLITTNLVVAIYLSEG